MAVDEGISLARRLWAKFRKEYSVFALYSPFFVWLASSTLHSPTTFRHFISQDLHFLKAFALAYELAEDCADDDDDKNDIRDLRKRIIRRLQTHDTFVQECGFELADEGASNGIATNKYTDFLLATASGKIEGERSAPGKIATPFEKTKVAAYTLAALAPCIRLYAFISAEIQGFLNSDYYESHIYRTWIDTYSSEILEETALQNEEMLDRLSICLTSEELEIIENLYHQAMKLLVDIVVNQPISDQQSVVPLSRMYEFDDKCHLTILCDFDLACTAFDSAAILAEIALITAPKADIDGSDQTQLARMSSADLRSTWDVLSTQYTEEFEQSVESVLASNKVEEFDYESLCNALEQLAAFERKANERVVESGVLKGLNVEDIKRAGQSLIQDGCRSFFQKVVKNENLKADVHVLSYCWCNDLIVSAFSSGDLNVLNVHSNELVYEESVTTGEIVKKMESPMEKLQAFNDILINRKSEGKHLTVYIGGSVGDLLCLLEADIGIVIGSSSSLRRLGDHFGVSFVPLFSGLVKRQRELAEDCSSNWKPMSGILYTVSSWAEIQAFILGT